MPRGFLEANVEHVFFGCVLVPIGTGHPGPSVAPALALHCGTELVSHVCLSRKTELDPQAAEQNS